MVSHKLLGGVVTFGKGASIFEFNFRRYRCAQPPENKHPTQTAP